MSNEYLAIIGCNKVSREKIHFDWERRIKMTNNNQDVVWKANYAPFGKADITVDDVVNNLQFPGQYFDQETGLHQNGYRDYDPTTGRYLQSDSIGLDDGLNTYLYADVNPIVFVENITKAVRA